LANKGGFGKSWVCYFEAREIFIDILDDSFLTMTTTTNPSPP
jgi:hypothetical protein